MLGRTTKSILAFLMLAFAMGPAHAKWHEASSDNFVIYADDSPKDIQRFAEYLERYHAAMELVTGRKLVKPSPSNRVTIYVVGSDRAIKKLVGDKNSNVAGFYVPRAGGSVAFVQDIRFKSGYPHFSTTVLLHEYAHHFLISSSRYAMPRWLSEGAAEFFAAAGFPSNGGVEIGKPAQHRAGDLLYSAEVTIHELFDDELYRSKRKRKYDAYYGRSWLLYHYLTFNDQRSGQLSAYWRSLGEGTDSTEAAKEVFGDLDQLEKELDTYLKKRRMFQYTLAPEAIQIGPVRLREMTEGEAEIMPLIIRSKRGVDREQALELLPEVQEVANAFPADAKVLSALAEAEYDAGNNDAAIVAAERAIVLNPNAKNAYVQSGFALFAKAAEADDQDAAFSSAMVPFTKLNQLENDHPLPLMYFYRSFVERGAEPNENARHALERAFQLAPFDHSLGLNVATMLAGEGKIELSKIMLRPLAANPHGGGVADFSKQMLDAMEAAPEGEPYFHKYVPALEIELPETDED